MDLRIITDISTEVLTAATVQQYIKFDDTSNTSEVSLIADMTSAVRALFEKRTGLSFGKRTYECFFRRGEAPFILPVSPVITVDKVETVDYMGTKTELTLNSGYYKRGVTQVEILTSDYGIIQNPFVTFDSASDLLVTFKAGFGENNVTQNLPADLKLAMYAQIKQWYDNRDDFYEFKLLGNVERVINAHKIHLL